MITKKMRGALLTYLSIQKVLALTHLKHWCPLMGIFHDPNRPAQKFLLWEKCKFLLILVPRHDRGHLELQLPCCSWIILVCFHKQYFCILQINETTEIMICRLMTRMYPSWLSSLPLWVDLESYEIHIWLAMRVLLKGLTGEGKAPWTPRCRAGAQTEKEGEMGRKGSEHPYSLLPAFCSCCLDCPTMMDCISLTVSQIKQFLPSLIAFIRYFVAAIRKANIMQCQMPFW